jgi:secreted trypsin-like serine protease
MCAGGGIFGGTTCVGDEGGPFFASIGGNFVLIGISHNFPQLCSGSTMTFTRVTSFLPWIRANM